MGQIRKYLKVKLIIGLIFKNERVVAAAERLLGKRFGKIDFSSECLPFTYTNYYEQELGTGLARKFIGFKKLIPPDDLAEIKIITNRIENKLSRNHKRLINIDPGYVDLAKLVLASTKDYNHRIFLGQGIYAEVTLCWRKKTFQPWSWTYPDYKSSEYIRIFNSLRNIYASDAKTL